jgi:hypothetical protein
MISDYIGNPGISVLYPTAPGYFINPSPEQAHIMVLFVFTSGLTGFAA